MATRGRLTMNTGNSSEKSRLTTPPTPSTLPTTLRPTPTSTQPTLPYLLCLLKHVKLYIYSFRLTGEVLDIGQLLCTEPGPLWTPIQSANTFLQKLMIGLQQQKQTHNTHKKICICSCNHPLNCIKLLFSLSRHWLYDLLTLCHLFLLKFFTDIF